MSDHWQSQFLPRGHRGKVSVKSNRILVANNELIMFWTELVQDEKIGIYKFELVIIQKILLHVIYQHCITKNSIKFIYIMKIKNYINLIWKTENSRRFVPKQDVKTNGPSFFILRMTFTSLGVEE